MHHAKNDEERSLVSSLRLSSLTVGGLTALVVYLAYHPSDSVLVEQGDAIWFCFAAICLMIVGQIQQRFRFQNDHLLSPPHQEHDKNEGNPDEPATISSSQAVNHSIILSTLTFLPWCLASWMMISAFATSPPGNLRASTNEAWLWVAAAAILHTVRGQFSTQWSRRSLICVMLIIASGLAVHGLHQYGYSLPKNRSDYQENPNAVLRSAGIDAPEGSAERMIFENRLMDGGPSATFALANTLAGYLLVATVICAALILTGWDELSSKQRFTLCSVGLLCLSCLLATRSRTAMLAFIVSIFVIMVARSKHVYQRRRSLAIGVSILLAISLGGLGFLNAFGNREWFEQAPTSVAFRLQYWRSTWALAVDSPWFGAGPGNFQAIYGKYKEASASEQIAEPHHFLMETLAAGGFPALIMLLIVGCLVLKTIWNTKIFSFGEKHRSHDQSVEEPSGRPNQQPRAIYLGAGAGLLIVWVLGFVTLQLPDIIASIFAIPVALMFAAPLDRALAKVTAEKLNTALAIASAALLLHLSMSGGWTVPGLAIWVWVLVGMIVGQATVQSSIADLRRRKKNMQLANLSLLDHLSKVLLAGLISLLLIFWWITIRPIQQKTLAIAALNQAQQVGNRSEIKRAIEEALIADRWSPEPAILLADFHRWNGVQRRYQNESDGRKNHNASWIAAVKKIRQRVQFDAGIERVIGVQAIHLYQRWGKDEDLEFARDAFQRGLDRSPSDEWLVAQLSLIHAALGEKKEAQQLAKKAIELSRLGNNIERELERQLVYPPLYVGDSVKTGPQRESAAVLIQELVNIEPM